MKIAWPRLHADERAADMRWQTLVTSLAAHAVLLALVLTSWGREVTGLRGAHVAVLIGLHQLVLLAIQLTRRLPDDHPAVRGVYAAAPVILFGLTGFWAIAATGSPDSWAWVFYYLYLGIAAQVFTPVPLLRGLILLWPLVTVVWFSRLGFPPERLALPVLHALVGSCAYDQLARGWVAIHAARREKARLARAALHAQGIRERLRLVEELRERLGPELEGARAEAARVGERVAHHDPDAPARLTGLGEQLARLGHDLRATVWALEPRDLPLDAVVAHLRRVAAELAPGSSSLECRLPSGTVLGPAERVTLLARIREEVPTYAHGVDLTLSPGEGGRSVLILRGRGEPEPPRAAPS